MSQSMSDAEWEKLRSGGFGPPGAAVSHGTTGAVQLQQAQGVSREAARRMTYNQYTVADAERQRLTAEGQRRDLTGQEVSRLRHAQAAVVGYLDYVFGPETEVVYARSRPAKLGKTGRIGRLIGRR